MQKRKLASFGKDSAESRKRLVREGRSIREGRTRHVLSRMALRGLLNVASLEQSEVSFGKSFLQ